MINSYICNIRMYKGITVCNLEASKLLSIFIPYIIYVLFIAALKCIVELYITNPNLVYTQWSDKP